MNSTFTRALIGFRRPVISVGRARDYRARSRGFEPRPDDLRISIYSDFLWAVLINTKIFLRGSKLQYAKKTELSKCSWYSKREVGVTMHFSEIIKHQFGIERHTFLCTLKLFTNI